jgi:hypothetical protein
MDGKKPRQDLDGLDRIVVSIIVSRGSPRSQTIISINPETGDERVR